MNKSLRISIKDAVVHVDRSRTENVSCFIEGIFSMFNINMYGDVDLDKCFDRLDKDNRLTAHPIHIWTCTDDVAGYLVLF
jgi:hypothetical protein